MRKNQKNKDEEVHKDLEKIIERLEREIKQLKQENKSLKSLLKTTEEYLLSLAKNDKLSDTIAASRESAISKPHGCPNCGSSKIKIVDLGLIKLLSCTNCDYRNKIND